MDALPRPARCSRIARRTCAPCSTTGELDRAQIEAALSAAKGNVTRAARAVRIPAGGDHFVRKEDIYPLAPALAEYATAPVPKTSRGKVSRAALQAVFAAAVAPASPGRSS
jgi:hypothetical protein